MGVALSVLHTALVHVHLQNETNLKQAQTWLWKYLGQNGYQNGSFWNVRKGKQIHQVLDTLSGLHSGCNDSSPPTLLVRSIPRNTSVVVPQPARKGWEGAAHSDLHSTVYCEYLNLKWFHSHSFKKMYVSSNEHFYSIIFLKISGGRAAALIKELPLFVYLASRH